MWLGPGTLHRSFVYCAALLKGTDTKGQDSNFSGAQSMFSEASQLSKEETSSLCTISSKDAYRLLLKRLHVCCAQWAICCAGVLWLTRQLFSIVNAGKHWRNLWLFNISVFLSNSEFLKMFLLNVRYDPWDRFGSFEAASVPRSCSPTSHLSARNVSQSESLLKARLRFYVRHFKPVIFL